MAGTPNCETCARLEAQEGRLRAAYDQTVRSLSKSVDGFTVEQYEATKQLADNVWERLQAEIEAFDNHCQSHLPDLKPVTTPANNVTLTPECSEAPASPSESG